MDIQERLTAFAMLGAGWVMWLLVALSIVAVAIALERAYVFFSRRDDARALREDLQRMLGKGDLEGARTRMKQSKSFEAEVVGAALEVADQGAHAVAHLEQARDQPPADISGRAGDEDQVRFGHRLDFTRLSLSLSMRLLRRASRSSQ